MKSKLTREHITFIIFVAFTFLFGLTPMGYVELSGMDMTFTHIPVIVGSVVLGPLYGMALGLVFALTSIIRLAMSFSSVMEIMSTVASTSVGALCLGVIILIVPRVIAGLLPSFIYKGVNRFLMKLNEKIRLLITGAVASLLHTVLFLTATCLFSGKLPLESYGVEYDVLTIVKAVGINGIVEAVASAGVVLVAMLIFCKYNKNEDLKIEQ